MPHVPFRNSKLTMLMRRCAIDRPYYLSSRTPHTYYMCPPTMCVLILLCCECVRVLLYMWCRYMSSDGACAAMISNICPAASQAALTTSTLMYAQLIMSAGTATPTTSTSKRCAAVDKVVERGGTGAPPARAPVDRWAPVPLPLRK
jgi:hypothetical protein